MTLILIICALSASLSAPPDPHIPVMQTEALKPFEKLYNAIRTVESGGDSLAIGDKHLKSHSYGEVQIRMTRLDDYYQRTGIRYTTQDMFNPAKAKQVFMFYASQIGPYDTDRIIKSWNGSGPMTEIYLKKVKRYL